MPVLVFHRARQVGTGDGNLFFSAAAIYLRAYGERAWGFPVTGQSHSWRGGAGCFRACGELDLTTNG
jgi:hypothetical protein